MKRIICFALLGALFLFIAPTVWPKGDPAKGKEIYLRICAHCHGKNPAWGNFKNPALTGSSRELLQARILRAAYPPGYKPKKPTKTMPPFPYLKPHIDDIYAFLNQ